MATTREMNAATIRRMVRTPRLLTPLMLAALGLAGAARAQDAGSSTNPSTRELMERIERLEASNRALASEVNTLRSTDGDAWLTEQRAAEIRGIVSDVLADSATRDSLQTSVSTAGWNDGFFLQSADGRFRMEVGGMMQMRYIYSYIPDGLSGIDIPAGAASSWMADNVETRSGFDTPNTQIDLKGHVFGPSWQYKIKGAFSNTDEAMVGQNPFGNLGSGSGTFRVLDAYMRAEVSDDFAVRAGQFRLPFAREQMVDDEYQLGVSRSTVVEHLGIDRSQGVEASWYSNNARAMVAFSNGGTDNIYGSLKAVGSDPMNSEYASDGVDWAFTGRFEWKLAGKWSQFNSMTSPPGDEYGLLFGIAGHAQEGDPDGGTTSVETGPNTWYALTADLTAMYGGATFFGAVFYHYTDSQSAYVTGSNNFNPADFADIGTTETWGAVVQASYYILPKWEVFGRFEYGTADITNINALTNPSGAPTLENGNDLTILSVGLNWYIDGEDFKWTSDAGVAFDAIDGIWWNGANGWRATSEQNEIVVRSQLQIAF